VSKIQNWLHVSKGTGSNFSTTVCPFCSACVWCHHLKLETKTAHYNHLGGGSVVRAWNQEVCSSVVSGSSHVVAHMMVTGGLHGR